MDDFVTDRQIMLGAEDMITTLISSIQSGASFSQDSLVSMLLRIQSSIHMVTNSKVEYQVVVNHLDENIAITDRNGLILYINPAFERNVGIAKEALVGQTVSDLLVSGKYLTNSVVPEVLRTKQRIMKLFSTPGNGKPNVEVGVPIFDVDGQLLYVVASNRILSSFAALRDNFHTFLSSLHAINEGSSPAAVKVNEGPRMRSAERSMVGNSPAMRDINDFIKRISDTDASVLITGESGTGKELIANAIYNVSRRRGKPFIKVNCSSIPGSLIESELFGYEKGAFSGANTQGKQGLFEAANEGTILLDEIGEMPMDAQAKLLRVLQSSEVTRVGGTKPTRLNIRVIASTNCNLKKKIKEGTFRSDLYYRLHIIPIHVPPLRERTEDIPLLCQHFVNIFSNQYHRSITLSEENVNLLCSYSWPGNIRELRNVMEYLVVCCSDISKIENSMLSGILDFYESPAQAAPVPENMTLNEAVANCEKELLMSTMNRSRTMKEAAQKLGVDISTISRKLKQYGLSPKGADT